MVARSTQAVGANTPISKGRVTQATTYNQPDVRIMTVMLRRRTFTAGESERMAETGILCEDESER
jgi:hypothetical protein